MEQALRFSVLRRSGCAISMGKQVQTRISHGLRCIGALDWHKFFCENDLEDSNELSRCRRSAMCALRRHATFNRSRRLCVETGQSDLSFTLMRSVVNGFDVARFTKGH